VSFSEMYKNNQIRKEKEITGIWNLYNLWRLPIVKKVSLGSGGEHTGARFIKKKMGKNKKEEEPRSLTFGKSVVNFIGDKKTRDKTIFEQGGKR